MAPNDIKLTINVYRNDSNESFKIESYNILL